MKHAEHLLNLFHSAYRRQEHDRAGDTNIHASNLINFCPRSYFLCRHHDRSYHGYEVHPIGTKYTFDLGHAIQKIHIKRLMTQQVIFGSWECRHCRLIEVGLQEDRRACPKCKCRAWKYRDLGIEARIPIPFKSGQKQQLVVRGNIDYVVAVTDSTGFVVDCKSIKAEDFDALKEPTIDYKRQVQLYMWLANRKGRQYVGTPRHPDRIEYFTIDGQTAVVAYSVKGARQQPFKPFAVEQDPIFIKKIESKLQLLAKSIATNSIPDMICKSQADSMAKACVARTLCFEQGG